MRQDFLEEGEAEGPASDGRDAQRLAGGGVEAVEPSLKRALDERGNCELVLAHAQHETAVLAPERPTLEQVAQSLFQEERVAAGPVCEQARDRLG